MVLFVWWTSRWVVEHQDGNRSIVIGNCNARQSVYIFGCKNSVIQVQGELARLCSHVVVGIW